MALPSSPASPGAPLRLGLIGYGADRKGNSLDGGRGDTLFSLATEKISGVRAAAICDTDADARERAAAKHPGCRIYADVQSLLASGEVDAILIGTPAQYHAPLAIAALEAGVHVLSEIPVVWSMEEARDLWAAHLKSPALYMTGANPNFLGYIDAMIDLKAQGILGEPVYAEAEYLHSLESLTQHTPWRVGLEPIRYCTHSLGPLLRVIGEDLKSVTCFSTGSHLNRREGDDDFMAALFRTRSGVVVRLLVSFINHAPANHYYRLYTTKGCFERTRPLPNAAMTETARTLFYTTSKDFPEGFLELPVGNMPPRYIGNPDATGHGGIDYAMLEAFIEAVRCGGPSPVSLREGLRMTLPGLFAAESARKGGQPIEINYPWEAGDGEP